MKFPYKNKIKNILKIIKQSKNIIQNPAPIYTERNQGIRLHLGSGNVNMQGWINIDVQDQKHIHIKEKDFKLDYFADNSISEIYLCHVLEHFTESEISLLMNIFKNKLIKRGILRISVPDFDNILEIYNMYKKDINKIHPILFGGQDNLYNFHKSAFNKRKLVNIFKNYNFKNIQEWETVKIFGSSIGDYSNQKVTLGNQKIDISLNICGEK